MIQKISAFFQSLHSEQVLVANPLTIEIATAVLLFEVMAADDDISSHEQQQVKQVLVERFSLTESEVEEIIATAQDQANHATDLYQFTNLINQHTDTAQRITIVEKLWLVAFADGHLSQHEQHLLRKIADLLHLRHNEYINAKIRAEQEMKKP